MSERNYYIDDETGQAHMHEATMESSRSPGCYVLTCNPSSQLKAWKNGAREQMEFWETVVINKTYVALNKTEEEAGELAHYWRGRYDAANNFSAFIADKSDNVRNALRT